MIRRLICWRLFLPRYWRCGVFWFLTIPPAPIARARRRIRPISSTASEMFFAGGCASCHAVPKQKDKTRLGGGLALIPRSARSTFPIFRPTRKDGIGAWSDMQFVTAMTKGDSPTGEHLYPGLSLYVVSHMRLRRPARSVRLSQDAAAGVRERARSRPAVSVQHPARARSLEAPVSQRQATFEPEPSKSAQWNRGAYLVNGPGHCAECHSPRNVARRRDREPALHRRAEPGWPGRRSRTSPSSSSRPGRRRISPTRLTDGMTPDADLRRRQHDRSRFQHLAS